jgi:rod shape-determining protein MreB
MKPFLQSRLGIDLGTANTLVYVPKRGVVLNEPTVVAIDRKNNAVLAVGSEAYTMVGKTPDDIVAYRPMKSGVIADYRITEAMISYYLAKSLSRYSLLKPDIIVSVPAGVTLTEKDAVVEAALKAGAKSAYAVKEPILAAIGAGVSIQEPSGHMIVDIGGGTTDVAVISLGGIVASESVKIAGNKIDASIIEFVKKKHGLQIGDRTAERVKIEVGSAIALDDPLVTAIKGRSMLDGLPRNVEINSNQIIPMIQPELNEMIDAIKRVLQATPPELASDVIDNGILMTGGTSLLREFDTLISNRVGVKAHVAEEALLCVAKGTGEVLAHLDLYKRRLLSKWI